MLDTILVAAGADPDAEDFDFKQIVGPAVMSRIQETGEVFELTGSYRQPRTER